MEEYRICAKVLFGPDMGFLYDSEEVMLGRCPVCGNKVEDIPNLSAKIKRRKGNFFNTYDGFTLVSQRFKDFCKKRAYPDLEFEEMTRMKGLYYFLPQREFELKSKTLQWYGRFHFECCGAYDELVTEKKYSLQKADNFILPSDDFIYRSNFRFGYSYRKGYLIIVGLQTMKALEDEGMGKLWFTQDVYECIPPSSLTNSD